MRFISAVVIVFVAIMGYEWFFHGYCMKEMYDQTADLWRGEENMLLTPMLVGQFLMALGFCSIYALGFAGRGIGAGIGFGLLMALFMAARDIIFYAVQPFPEKMVGFWIAGGTLELVIVGMIVALIYRSYDH